MTARSCCDCAHRRSLYDPARCSSCRFAAGKPGFELGATPDQARAIIRRALDVLQAWDEYTPEDDGTTAFLRRLDAMGAAAGGAT